METTRSVIFLKITSRRGKVWGGRAFLEPTAWVGADCSNTGLRWWAGAELPCATENQTMTTKRGGRCSRSTPPQGVGGSWCWLWRVRERRAIWFLSFCQFPEDWGKVSKDSHIHGIETPCFFSSLFTSFPPHTTLCSPFSSSFWRSPWRHRTLASIVLMSNSACFSFVLFYFCCNDTTYIYNVFVLYKVLYYIHSELGTYFFSYYFLLSLFLPVFSSSFRYT